MIPQSPSINILTFFNAKKKFWNPNQNELFFYLSRSSWSIFFICLLRLKKSTKKKINIFLPEYFCKDPIPLLKMGNINIVYYEIDDEFYPDLQNIKKISEKVTPDIFLTVHYFGKPIVSNDLKMFCIKNNCWYIEDATHCIKRDKNIGDQGDFVLFSPYKHLALPNGAISIVRSAGPSKLNLEDFSNININRFFKTEIQKFESNKDLITNDTFFSLKWIFKKSIVSLINKTSLLKRFYTRNYKEGLKLNDPEVKYHYKISYLSKFLLVRYDLNKISYIICRNQNFFKDALSDKIKIHEAYKFIPSYSSLPLYMLPIKLNSINEAIDLINKGIPIVKWPLFPKESLKSSKKFKNIYFISLNHTISEKYFKSIFNHKRDLKKIKISKSSPEECLEIEGLNSSNINLTQSPYYGKSKSYVEYKEIDFYQIEIINQPVGYFQILKKKYFNIITLLRINRGPILIDSISINDRINIILKILKFGNIFRFKILSITTDSSYFSIESLYLKGLRSFRLKFTNWKSSLIYLNKSIENILIDLKPKWRNSLRKALKEEIDINKSSKAIDINIVLQHNIEDAKKKKYKGINPEIINKMVEIQSLNECIYAFRAEHKGKDVGGILVSRQKKNIIYLIGWSSKAGRKLNVNYILLWEAIIYFKSIDCKIFDLGGLFGNDSPIDFFKLGMNGNYYENSGEYIAL
mgnify:CR=1 FL=1